jgi:uncharacterized protein
MRQRGIFLTAAWRQLVLLNFPVEPSLLKEHIPHGTELDFHQGETYVSIVGFLFQDTSICGLPALGHRDFTEINLRFYVRRKVENQWRRGVVFIQEIVPRRAVTWIARTLYGENYITRPMQQVLEYDGENSLPRTVEYRWQQANKWNRVGIACPDQMPAPPQPDSLEEFIIEHYWGYTFAAGGVTREYHVEHPRWRILLAEHVTWDCDAVATYGEKFGTVLSQPPRSAFVALGSEVAVRWANRL